MLTLSAHLARPTGDVAPLAPGPGLTGPRSAAPVSGSVTLGRRAFRLTGRSHDFEAVVGGILGQQIIVRFTAVVLPAGLCAVANYEAFGLAKPEPGRPFGAGSTLQVHQPSFAIGPGQKVARVVSANSELGTVVYTLSFSAVKVFGGCTPGHLRRGRWLAVDGR